MVHVATLEIENAWMSRLSLAVTGSTLRIQIQSVLEHAELDPCLLHALVVLHSLYAKKKLARPSGLTGIALDKKQGNIN